MNKLAPIVFILLLSCGVALWFLASDSLNFHIKSQIQKLGSKLSEKQVSVDNVTIRSYQSSGIISNFIITSSASTNISKIPLLSIDSIDLVINRESLQEEIIVIDSLIISGLTASYSRLGSSTTLEQLLTTVKHNMQQLTNSDNTSSQDVQQPRLMPPNLKVTKVIVKSALLQQLDEKNKIISTDTLPKIEWLNISPEAGLSGEEIGIKIFEQLLIELAAHSK